jgi:pimeloyl-ACP methyl ester carboxylesterase
MTERPLKIHIDAGAGPEVVILPGFGMTPEVYAGTARLLSERCRVVVPTLYGVRGPWRYQEMVGRFAATIEEAGLVRPTLIAHSFGGGILLGFCARRPDRVSDAVFVDTLAVAREFVLAREATSHPTHLLRLATPKAAGAFIHNAAWHPRQLAEAAWWGFRSARQHEIAQVAAAGVRTHVMWASRDSLLDREDGRAFAHDLRASFNVAFSPRGPVDHDWMYRHPHLFVSHLEDLGLAALDQQAANT